jgi:hypothetical protein
VAAITCLYRGFFPFTQLNEVTKLVYALDFYSRMAVIACIHKGFFPSPSSVK